MPNMNTITVEQLRESIKNQQARSTWNIGIKTYALELLKEVTDEQLEECVLGDFHARVSLRNLLLNGVKTWYSYSYGGHSLILDMDIANRLCSPSKLKRCKDEIWLDVQALALAQAFDLIADHWRQLVWDGIVQVDKEN